MDDLKQKSINAFLWDLSGKFAIYAMSFIISIILARILSPSDFGLLAMVVVIIAIAQIFTDTGLSSALIQKHKLLPIHYSSVFYFNAVTACVIGFLTFISSEAISKFYGNPQLIPIIQVMSISFLINALGSVQGTKLRKELKYKTITKIKFTSSLVSGLIGISLAMNGAGVWSLVYQSLASGVVFNILIWRTSDWWPSLAFSLKALNKLWKFGFRIFISNLLDTVFTRIDIIVIGKLFLPSTLGYFQRAKSLSTMASQYSSASLMAVLYPVLSSIKNDLPRFQRTITKSLSIISFVSFMIIGMLFVISEELIILLFTEKWRDSIDFFDILILSGFGYPISALLVNVLTSRGKSKNFLRLEVIKKTMIAVNLYVGFSYGIEAYLYGLIIVTCFGVTLNALFAAREISLHLKVIMSPIVSQMLISGIVVLTVSAVTYSMDTILFLALAAKVLLFIATYIGLNIILGTSSYRHVHEEAKPLLKRIRSRSTDDD